MDEPEHPLFEALIRGIGGAGLGILLGILFLGIGVLRALGAVLGGTHVDTDGFWPAASLYVLGFAAGGAIMAALWAYHPSPARQYLAGAAGGVAVLAAVARIVDGPSASWGPRTYITIVLLGVVFGAAFTRGSARRQRPNPQMQPTGRRLQRSVRAQRSVLQPVDRRFVRAVS